MSEYPSNEDLAEVTALGDDLAKWKDLLALIFNIWNADNGKAIWNRSKLELHTGGWSGNEDIVNQLQGTMFWFFYWQKSERGGHYYFTVTPAAPGKEGER